MARKTKPAVYHIPITKARINLGQVVRRVHTNKECFILEKDGIPVAGLIDIDALEDYLEMQDPDLAGQIREGHSEYRSGKGKDLDTFLTEIRTEVQKKKKK